jgi:hypothetical protein
MFVTIMVTNMRSLIRDILRGARRGSGDRREARVTDRGDFSREEE